MPKYCVEFIADVCTLPSQEDSDWTDSRDQEPFTVNPLSESDWDIRLTPFIVPDPNKVAPSSHNIYPANCPNLKPSLLQNTNPCCWDSTSRNCAKDKTVSQSSHVTSMGNTACCVPDGRKIIWDEYERHPSSTVNCYARDTVPIHRTFVISRAVQCSSCPSTEQTMHNNHSYHDIQIPHESSRGGPQYQQHYSFTVNKTITSPHNPKRLTFFPRDILDSEGRTDESKQNSHKITSVRSNSEMSVDVSSLSAQRCSSVTPPVKNTVDYALETNRDLMHSNALLLEDDIDSLSATISAGSNSNFRETSKRHRQRPSPYTRPKLKSSGQNEIGRHFSNAFALDRSEHRQRGPKKRQSSLDPMFGVSAFGDGLIQKSSQICFDKSTLIGLEDGYQLGLVQEPHPQTHTNEVETDDIIGSNVRPTQDRSNLGDSTSTLEETSSVSSLEHPQNVRFTVSTSEQPNQHSDCGKQRNKNRAPQKDRIQPRELQNVTQTNNSTEQKFFTSKAPSMTTENTNGVKVKIDCGFNKVVDKKAITQSIPELNKHSPVKSALPRPSNLPVHFSTNRSDLMPLTDTRVAEIKSISKSVLKTRSLSESRIPTNNRRYLPSPRVQMVGPKEENPGEDPTGNAKQDHTENYTPEKSQLEQLNENTSAKLNSDTMENLPKDDNLVSQTNNTNDPSPICTTDKQCKPIAGILKEKQPNTRLSRSLERTTTIDSLGFSELPKTPKRRESFCSTSPTKKSENLFVPLKAQLSTQARLQLPKDIELITSWDHKQLQSEPLSSVASCMELQRPRTSPSLLRTGRQSLMRKRNSAPISLKLPQPTPTTKITPATTATTKPTPMIIPTTTRLSVMRRRSNESILSAPLHIYTPHSRCRGKLVRHKFFIPESANIEAILADPDDRRIKAICERYKCDMEIYSKLPWCGFLQYIIVLAARDTATLRRCARTLDCRLNWCLDAQIR
ncbi:hypothetical protein D915_001402 [Fasciola hepatica]|uniref:Uncharacterized protein n=1 Tax=Fasciola hepatica TaxID=6192 RepID=A0A4E0RQ49_FASHE|nr:hypothetical protein D915_001402 [Fasciola hepatica]